MTAEAVQAWLRGAPAAPSPPASSDASETENGAAPVADEQAAGTPLPPHHPHCLGCGPDNPAGQHLVAYRVGDGVASEHTFTTAQTGAPGLAHGGAVATLCDDLLGMVLTVHEIPAVTRTLSVDYLAPVVLGEPHRLWARLQTVEGRKLWLRTDGHGPDGTPRFAARGLFIRVGVEHFLAGLSDQERRRAGQTLADGEQSDRAGQDVTAW